MKFFILSIYLILLTSCAHFSSENKVQKITLLHTNDHHGRFWKNKEGEYGLAARATLINELKKKIQKEGGEVLLLDAGDVNTGVPQSDLLDAEPDFRGMGKIGYDVMAVGNHEFDNPVETILKQQKEWAKFPFVSANIYNKKTNKRIFPSHITKKVGNINVTVFGLTTEDTPKKSNPLHTKDLKFIPAVEEAKKLVPKLRPNADLLIALTHIGHYPDERHGADAPGDVTLARVVDGIDVIIGGHTQKPLFEPDIQNGAIIVQAYEWGKYVGRIDLEVYKGQTTLKHYELIPVNLKSSHRKIPENNEILELLRPFKEKGDESLLIKIGEADEDFNGNRDSVRYQETNLGNLVSKAYKSFFKTDIGIMNAGGIRDTLYKGVVTIESILTVLPFGGEVVTASMTGAELKSYLKHLVFELNQGSGSFPQMSGLEIVADRKTRTLKEIFINGKKLKEEETYSVALPEFIARGGDKYPALQYKNFGERDADILINYIKRHSTLRTKDFAPTGYVKFL